ncbi:hypothetical protein FOQG_18726 [Fusarium oxysporum f. sp. raphani 54005]|uniref:Uncharacterized protein n=1 Tax=Fusarium oxysporum f. sp. raphani 54005 TaxID=1089458 RepID=X0B319_FUSOX|nr:hypothetical protein FOQG_18726 [Fusarium oxysporum f. sp. raphani 54005]
MPEIKEKNPWLFRLIEQDNECGNQMLADLREVLNPKPAGKQLVKVPAKTHEELLMGYNKWRKEVARELEKEVWWHNSKFYLDEKSRQLQKSNSGVYRLHQSMAEVMSLNALTKSYVKDDDSGIHQEELTTLKEI